MLLDEKGRLLGKINVLDLTVILILLIALIGVVYKFTASNTPTPFSRANRIEISFSVDEVADFAAEAITVGDEVRDRITGAGFGRVTLVEIQPSIGYGFDEEGRFVRSEKETLRAVRVVVEGEGIYTDNGATYGNIDFFINRQLEVHFGNVSLFARISGLRLVQ